MSSSRARIASATAKIKTAHFQDANRLEPSRIHAHFLSVGRKRDIAKFFKIRIID